MVVPSLGPLNTAHRPEQFPPDIQNTAGNLRSLVEQYFAGQSNIALVIHVLDARLELQSPGLQILERG